MNYMNGIDKEIQGFSRYNHICIAVTGLLCSLVINFPAHRVAREHLRLREG